MQNDQQIVEDAAKEKQGMRLFDILVFSPILIYVGLSGKLNSTLRATLVVLGFTTIMYNGYYFLKYKQ